MLRIWPLYFLYILVCLIVLYSEGIFFKESSTWYYLFLTPNIPFIINTTIPLLVHYWSLGVEEQFYLFWPWFSRMRNNIHLRLIILLVFAIILMKLSLHFFSPHSIIEKSIHVTRFHCMMIGGAASLLYYQRNQLFLSVVLSPFVQIITWVGMFLVLINKFHFMSVLDNEIISVLTVALIIGQVMGKGLISLENKVFDYLGKISYGIYVIHPLLIFGFQHILRNVTDIVFINYSVVYGTIILTTIFAAHLSYSFFEKPFINLKNAKFSVIRSQNSLYENNK